MVATDPSTDERRRRKEALIRIIDLIAYATVAAGGIFALWLTPESVQRALAGFPWLIGLWGTLLLLGGAFGFVGRLSRFWVIETPGASAGSAGALIYFVILGAASLKTTTGLVASTLVLCMLLLMLRRYTELQIFTTDPGDRTFSQRLRAAIRRRTADAISRHT